MPRIPIVLLALLFCCPAEAAASRHSARKHRTARHSARKVQSSIDPQFVGHCHCVDCRKSSGTGHCTLFGGGRTAPDRGIF